eukprot:230634_1
MSQLIEEKKDKSDNNSDKNDKLIIALGSSSYIKKKVVEETFSKNKCTIFGLKFPSGVPEQPVGKKQTQQGAKYRADKAKELKPNAFIWIGIENGMYRQPPMQQNDKQTNIFDYWFDVGCIVIIYKNKNNELIEDVIWSDSLPIPIDAAKECLTEDGKAAKYNGNYTWSPLKDPHYELTNGKRPRKLWLLESLKKWKEKMEGKFYI